MNPTAAYSFTIVVPLFNERENLPRLEERLSAYRRKATRQPACVLFVDDGSTAAVRCWRNSVRGTRVSSFCALRKTAG